MIRSEHYFVKPMSVDEAAMQMNLSQQDFLVFQQRRHTVRERPVSTKRRQLRPYSATKLLTELERWPQGPRNRTLTDQEDARCWNGAPDQHRAHFVMAVITAYRLEGIWNHWLFRFRGAQHRERLLFPPQHGLAAPGKCHQMRILDFLRSEAIICPLSANSKEEVLKELVEPDRGDSSTARQGPPSENSG